jgi:thioredoxin 1
MLQILLPLLRVLQQVSGWRDDSRTISEDGRGPGPGTERDSAPGIAAEASMSSRVVHVTDSDFDREVLQSQGPVLVDFWAPWCGPCLMIAPFVEAVAEARGPGLKVVKVDVDESPEVARQMGIRSIPTLMVFAAGELKEMAVGARPRAEIERMVDRAIAPSPAEAETRTQARA